MYAPSLCPHKQACKAITTFALPMVLQAAYSLSTYILPPKYYLHAVVAGVTGIVAYAFAQGRTTNRERDLHARTIIVTGAFTPLGLTLVSSLASRGAHIIALSQYPLDHAQPTLLIPLLRSTTNNENIYAEYADMTSPESVRAFCTKYLTGNDQRIDALLFAHEYMGIGSLFGPGGSSRERREVASLATFLMMTLLLPSLLVAPVERDIRIINVINPFYAAVVPTFSSTLIESGSTLSSEASKKKDPLFVSEGQRALRTAILTRHIQRVLNALPNRAPTPDASSNKTDQPTPAPRHPAPCNIISVSVSPGLSRADTIAPLLRSEKGSNSILGVFLYIALYPFLWLLTKSPTSAMQSILHVLFLPTPFKRALAQASAAADPVSAPTKPKATNKAGGWDDALPEEVLKPGALYRECSIVTLKLPPLPTPPEGKDKDTKKGASQDPGSDKGKGKQKAESETLEPAFELEDDGEYGGEAVGRMVWEWYEVKLKEWEAKEKVRIEAEKRAKEGKEQEVVEESDLHPKVVVTSPSG